MKILIFEISILILYGSHLTMSKDCPSDIYIKVGTVTSSIASTFDAYKGLSRLRCLAKCSQDTCLMAAWGASDHQGDCRILIRRNLPSQTQIAYNQISTPLAIYVRTENQLPFIDKSYAFLLHSETDMAWENTRAFCKSYSLGFYTPSNIEHLKDLFKDYEDWWAGSNDMDVEKSFQTDEGTSLPIGDARWCSGEPNDLGTEDCTEIHDEPCINDESCSYYRQGFCKIGD